MTGVQEAERQGRGVPLGLGPTTTERKLRPVKAWAVAGVGFLALEAYCITTWITSGNAKPTPDGPTPIPGWMKAAGTIWTVAGLFGVALFLYVCLIRPWRRSGRITLDGLFCLAYLSLYWQDPLLNYFQTWFTYNSMFLNFGNWNSRMPGWLSPNGNLLPEPPLFTGPTYAYLVFGAVIVANHVMRKAKERWPNLGKFGLVMLCFWMFVVFDCIFEPMFLTLGFYAYPGAISWATIFHGHYYQFPLYEPFLIGATWTLWASLRYFRNDKGQTMVERGVDELKLIGAKKVGVRFLALTGAVNAIMMFAYVLPCAVLSLYASPWPEDFLKRSYLTNGFCGPDTTYACPGPAIPIPRPDSAHVSPEGELIVPEGAELPK